MKKQTITIETLNYFADLNSADYNGKVLYKKNGKSYLAHIYLDFFWKKVYFPKQPKECKVLVGLEQAINKYQGF
jgi:hypothetical protein